MISTLFALMLLCASPPCAELTLEAALPIEGPDGLEPSGLVVRDDALFMVSDKHDDVVFRLLLDEDRARALPHVRFDAGLSLWPRDFEGIEATNEGFLLVSEARSALLEVKASGACRWLERDAATPASEGGLLARRNAGFEGLAVLKEGLLLAAEREPRGLVHVGEQGDVDVYVRPRTIAPLPPGRNADYSALHAEEGRHFALVRNASAIVLLSGKAEGFVEQRCWSYAHVENDARWAYRDDQFGLGEGLAMDAERVYVVLDNNNDARRTDPEDRRPLLLVFRRPANMSVGTAASDEGAANTGGGQINDADAQDDDEQHR